MTRPSVSVIIPSYESAQWLPETLQSIITAVACGDVNAEVVIVDDGSTDNTVEVVEFVAQTSDLPIRLVSQNNRGRFLAVWTGIEESEADNVLILNSRQLLQENFFQVYQELIAQRPNVRAWCSHVDTDPNSPLVGHFWSIPTAVFWGAYWKDLKQTDITIENFDNVPKGTGGLLVEKKLFEAACLAIWPQGNVHLVSDDTKLLRYIAAESPIVLEPMLKSTYRPRISTFEFLKHAFGRGTMFVDSYAGTSLLRNVILTLLLMAPPVLALLVLLFSRGYGFGPLAIAFGTFYLAVIVFSVLGMRNHASSRAAASFIVFALPFAVYFWAGLLRGAIVHRKTFQLRKHSEIR